jgi:hypothetical protein
VQARVRHLALPLFALLLCSAQSNAAPGAACAAATACAAERRLASLSASNATRRTTLERLSSSAAGVRTEALSALPTLLRYQSLTHSHVSAMLLREQRQKLRELVEVLPLRVSALRGGGGGPVHIAMRDVRLPHSGVPPVGGWPEPQVRVCMYTCASSALPANTTPRR